MCIPSDGHLWPVSTYARSFQDDFNGDNQQNCKQIIRRVNVQILKTNDSRVRMSSLVSRLVCYLILSYVDFLLGSFLALYYFLEMMVLRNNLSLNTQRKITFTSGRCTMKPHAVNSWLLSQVIKRLSDQKKSETHTFVNPEFLQRLKLDYFVIRCLQKKLMRVLEIHATWTLVRSRTRQNRTVSN